MSALLQYLENETDPRRSRILAGAIKVFLTYGFQRTTMNTIAQAAEISRPALYLQFRNKTDIYRALVSDFLDQLIKQTRETLERRDQPLSDRLHEATSAFMDLLDEIEETPHGVELLDMQNSLAGDIVASGRVEISAMFTRAIEMELAARGEDLGIAGVTPAGLADLLLDALDGLKARRPDRKQQRRLHGEYVRAVVTLVGR
jgi:AcrR family transcriptional regulator